MFVHFNHETGEVDAVAETLPEGGLYEDGRTVSGPLESLKSKEIQELGWYEFDEVDVPEYDPTTHRLVGPLYERQGSGAIQTYELEVLEPDERQDRLEAAIQAESREAELEAAILGRSQARARLRELDFTPEAIDALVAPEPAPEPTT